MKERHKSIAAVYLILKQESRVLLLKRFNTGYCDDQYGLPSGHVEKDESIIDAMVREASEEIGVVIRSADLRLAHIRDRSSDDGHRIDFFFTCERWSGELVNAEPHKCSDLRWFGRDQLPKDIISYIQQVLDQIDAGHIYSLENW